MKNRCIDCSILIKANIKRCKNCRTKVSFSIQSVTLAEIKNLYKDKNSLALAAKIRGYSKTLYERSDKPKYCLLCGYKKHYEVCHIKPVKDFDDNATMAEIHALDNLVALCPNCHWEFDHGLVNL